MPSSNKTQHLLLNKWLGTDKPKKDDFNSDNQKIDEACRLLSQSIELLESTVQNKIGISEQALSSLSASLSASISSHTGNNGIHVTQSEKDAWSNNSGAILGSYQGDGTTSRKITLGFEPLFVFLFPAGDGLARANWTGLMLSMNSGCITKLGSSLGMTLNSDGFTVEYYYPGGVDGFQIKNNAPGVKYIYLAFKQ